MAAAYTPAIVTDSPTGATVALWHLVLVPFIIQLIPFIIQLMHARPTSRVFADSDSAASSPGHGCCERGGGWPHSSFQHRGVREGLRFANRGLLAAAASAPPPLACCSSTATAGAGGAYPARRLLAGGQASAGWWAGSPEIKHARELSGLCSCTRTSAQIDPHRCLHTHTALHRYALPALCLRRAGGAAIDLGAELPNPRDGCCLKCTSETEYSYGHGLEAGFSRRKRANRTKGQRRSAERQRGLAKHATGWGLCTQASPAGLGIPRTAR